MMIRTKSISGFGPRDRQREHNYSEVGLETRLQSRNVKETKRKEKGRRRKQKPRLSKR